MNKAQVKSTPIGDKAMRIIATARQLPLRNSLRSVTKDKCRHHNEVMTNQMEHKLAKVHTISLLMYKLLILLKKISEKATSPRKAQALRTSKTITSK